MISAAGLGMRLFPVTKEQPRDMLSAFCTGEEWRAMLEAYRVADS